MRDRHRASWSATGVTALQGPINHGHKSNYQRIRNPDAIENNDEVSRRMHKSLLRVTECFSEKSSTVRHNVTLEAINSKLKIVIEQRKALLDTGLPIDTQK